MGGGHTHTCALSLPHGCPPTALAGREPTQPEGMCSATLSGNKPAAAERPQGPWGAEPQLGIGGRPDGFGGERDQGHGAICSSPARVPVGRGPARAGTSTAGDRHGAVAGPSPVELGSVSGAGAGLGHPTQPCKRHQQAGWGRDGAPHGCCHLPLAARPLGPCPTEGSPPGPCSPRWGCQGALQRRIQALHLEHKETDRVCHIQESERG